MAIGQNQGSGTDVRIDGMSDAKRRLLEQRLRGASAQASADPVVPRPPGAKVPLSAEQRRVWLHASQQPDLAIYNEPFTVRRYGSFNLKVLEASLNEILGRHEAWRTSFSAQGEEVIHPFVRVTLPFLDLSGLPEAQRESEALRLATADAQNPIPLDAVPLFRARVVRIKPDEHRLYLTFHHIVFDGVSIARIFTPELTAIYAAFEKGEPSPLPEPALQYADYSLWRERHLASPAVRQKLAYWLEHLSGELPVLRLPEDRPRPAVASHRGSMETFEFPYDLVKDLRELSSAQGVTLYITLLAAFKVLLFRYSAQNDLIVGSVTDARRRPELESVMGYFLDTFAIRTRPSADLRFSEYLSQTRDSALGGLAAAEVPFDRVVHEVNPKRSTSHHPIFQAFFSIRPPMPRIAEGWNLTQMDVTVGTTKFMLHLELGERPDFKADRIEARFLYNTDIWDGATIKRMSAHWLALLRSACENPEKTLGALSLLTPGRDRATCWPRRVERHGSPLPAGYANRPLRRSSTPFAECHCRGVRKPKLDVCGFKFTSEHARFVFARCRRNARIDRRHYLGSLSGFVGGTSGHSQNRRRVFANRCAYTIGTHRAMPRGRTTRSNFDALVVAGKTPSDQLHQFARRPNRRAGKR